MTGPVLQSQAPARNLADACGLPLGAYRRDHVHGCVVRTMRREQVRDLPALIALMDEEPEVRLRLRKAIAVATTGLFRDPDQLRWLDGEVMPSLTAGAKHIRTWSAGCAAGEEAFTLAMMLEWQGMLARSEIYGSDILEELLAEADSGMVGGARIPANLRGRVRWDLRDVASADAPAEGFDLILCRNVLTYLTPIAAEHVTRTLAESLSAGGVVVLARDEAIDTPEALGLTPITAHAYRRRF